jgi:hypothetical protein
MPPAEIQPALPARERPQTYVLDNEAIGTGAAHSAYHQLCSHIKFVVRPEYLVTIHTMALTVPSAIGTRHAEAYLNGN